MTDIDNLEDEYEGPSVGSMQIPEGATDRAIEKHFESGRLRVVQEKNDIFLSHIIDFIHGDGKDKVWGNLRPEYQRRLRWDNKRKSKLIESFIMNIPVPPIFLYEKSLGRFEVMDGQQRLNAISEFMSGDFALEGLEIWKALNGKNYSKLPPLIRRGIERAKISAITLMSDSSSSDSDSLDLRAQVFERLNTGGERLNAQELRNSIFSGSFNDLVINLSKDRRFTEAWGIPDHEQHTREDGTADQILKDNVLYKRMADVEIVLRFFSFKDTSNISGSVRAMLDSSMKTYRTANSEMISDLKREFQDSLDLCVAVFGNDVFRLPAAPDVKTPRVSRPLYDAQMVAMFSNKNNRDRIIGKKEKIKAAVMDLASPDSEHYALMVGRANTAGSIKDRITKVEDAIFNALKK